MKSIIVASLLLTTLVCSTSAQCIGRCDDHQSPYLNETSTETRMQYMMRRMGEDFQSYRIDVSVYPMFDVVGKAVPCEDGFATGYPCKNTDLLSALSHKTMGSRGGKGNDIWGWEDPESGREYAIVCQNDGTAFVDVTDPVNPIIKGRLPTKTYTSIWRDAKVFNNHAYIVSEATSHGVQVFDLTLLRKEGTNQIFTESGYYSATGRCHNIAINEETGTAFCVGSANVAKGGLYILDLNNDPKLPQFSAQFPDDGYVHDAQCVIYNGPDTKYKGREVCFCYNEDTLTIVDITDRKKMVMISRSAYKGYAYSHQGWLLEDHEFLLLDDELDEERNTNGNKGVTTTYVWDVRSLEKPKHTGYHLSTTTSIDHNLYIKGNLAYMANYCSGLRIVDVKGIKEGKTEEVAYFDVRPEDDEVAFSGSWSVYPYFKSGNIIVNSIERGLFVVRPTLST